MPSDPPRVPPAATNVLAILALLGTQRGPISAGTIATQLNIPRSSTYELLNALVERGYAIHFRESRTYGLGTAAFELGSGYTRQEPLARLGRPLLQNLVDRIGENVHLAVLHESDVLYLVEERAPRRPSLVTGVGVRLPSYLTASGRAILAWLPRPQFRAVIPGPAGATGARRQWSADDRRALDDVLRQTRARGYATEDEDITKGLASVALPVRDNHGWPIASVAVTFVSNGADNEAAFRRYAAVLTPLVAELGARLSPAVRPTPAEVRRAPTNNQ